MAHSAASAPAAWRGGAGRAAPALARAPGGHLRQACAGREPLQHVHSRSHPTTRTIRMSRIMTLVTQDIGGGSQCHTAALRSGCVTWGSGAMAAARACRGTSSTLIVASMSGSAAAEGEPGGVRASAAAAPAGGSSPPPPAAGDSPAATISRTVRSGQAPRRVTQAWRMTRPSVMRSRGFCAPRARRGLTRRTAAAATQQLPGLPRSLSHAMASPAHARGLPSMHPP